MEALTNPVIEHVTVVNEASWVNPVVTVAGVVLTAAVTLLISNRSLKAAEDRAAEEQSRHGVEVARLNDESEKAEERHARQIEAMLMQGRQEREVRFLRDLSDHLLAFASLMRALGGRIDHHDIVRIRQYGLKIYADFAEDDPAFADHAAYFLDTLARLAEEGRPETGKHTDRGRADEISGLAEEAAGLLLKWLNPAIRLDVTQRFEYFYWQGTFDVRKSEGT